MLYFVGGAMRAGKSTLARRLLTEKNVPYFSIDILMMGLAHGWPEIGLDPDATGEVRGERLWPLLRAMAVNILEEAPTHPTYLLEGDALLPAHIARLAGEHPGRVRACFIGYTAATPEEKIRAVRAVEPDWYTGFTDREVLDFVADAVRFSRYLEGECAALGLAYFDCSADLEMAVDGAFHYLVQPDASAPSAGEDSSASAGGLGRDWQT